MLHDDSYEVRSLPWALRCRRTPAARYAGLLKLPKEQTTGSWSVDDMAQCQVSIPLRLPCEARIPLHGSLRLQTDWRARQHWLLRSLLYECARALIMKADPMGDGLGTNRNNQGASCYKDHQNGASSSCRRTRWGT